MDSPGEKPRISIIAALSAHDRGIGLENKLLWHISDDLKRFKELTFGHPVIMGRKTFESILGYLGRPLPDRYNIVVTRDKNYVQEGALVAHSLDEALDRAVALGGEEVFIGGGADLWAQALPQADRLYLTLIDDKQPADTFFPEYKNLFSHERSREEYKTPEGLKYTWVTLERT